MVDQAGLFSAVITEFNNEAYQLLLPDPVDESKAILAHISFQLSRLPTAIRSGEAIPELQQPPPFQATQADVVVSTLWYSSLVCALIAASLGMLVKQWLQHYMKDDYAPTRERLRVRQLRFRGLCRWQVPAIIAFLPLLLRIALTLFLGGLIIFIHTLHPIVMWSVTSLIILWLASYCSSLVLPSVFADCPYKAPESLGFYIASRCWQDGFGDTVNRWISGYISWCDPEEFVKKDVAEDPHILATFDRTFSDHVLDTEVRECCRDMDEQSVMLCIDQVLRQRLQIRSNQDVWDDRDSEEIAQHRRITRKATEALINIVIDTMERSFDDETVIGMDERSWFGGAFQCIILLLGSRLWPSETALDTRLVGLLLRLKECATIPEADPYNMDSLHQDTQSFVLNLLSLRPSLFQKELVSCAPLRSLTPTLAHRAPVLVLPFLYGAASEHFSGRGSPEEMIKICRAILSIVVHMDPDVRDSDPWFKGFLVKWEVFMPNISSRIALLLPSKRFAVEHDIHCCRVKAAELGDTCIAEQLCARLEKALTENSRESGYVWFQIFRVDSNHTSQQVQLFGLNVVELRSPQSDNATLALLALDEIVFTFRSVVRCIAATSIVGVDDSIK